MVLLTLPAMLLFFISVKKASREMWVLRLGFSVFLGFVVYTNLVTLGLINGNRSRSNIWDSSSYFAALAT